MFKQIMETIDNRDALLHRLVICSRRILELAERQREVAQRLKDQAEMIEDSYTEHDFPEHKPLSHEGRIGLLDAPCSPPGTTVDLEAGRDVVHNAALISELIDIGNKIGRTAAEASLVQRDLEHVEHETRHLLGHGQDLQMQ